MRALLSTYGLRGDVEPMVGLAEQLEALGAELRVCAPPDLGGLLAGVGVPLVPTGQPVPHQGTGIAAGRRRIGPRTRPSWSPPSSTPSLSAAEEYDVPVATGVMPTGVWR